MKILRKTFSNTNAQLVVQKCGCVNIPVAVTPILEKHNCLELQPSVYKGGWEWYRMLSFSEKDVLSMFAELSKNCLVEILSRRAVDAGSVMETFLISTSALFGVLTDKQLHALTLAIENGYYRVPKKVTTQEIAKLMGQPRTTYEEHLRKAESKVLRSVPIHPP